MLLNYYKERESYINDGTIMLNQHNNIFTQTELQNLEKLADQLPFEHGEIGDADEPNYLEVGRLITDIDKPKIVNQTISKQVIGIVSSKKKWNSQILLDKQLHIRRMQYKWQKIVCWFTSGLTQQVPCSLRCSTRR